jgi:hypothetical protein
MTPTPLPVVLPTPLPVAAQGGVAAWVAYVTLFAVVVQIFLAWRARKDQREQMDDLRRRPNLCIQARSMSNVTQTEGRLEFVVLNFGKRPSTKYRVRLHFQCPESGVTGANSLQVDSVVYVSREVDGNQPIYFYDPRSAVPIHEELVRIGKAFTILWEIDDAFGHHYPEDKTHGILDVKPNGGVSSNLPAPQKR